MVHFFLSRAGELNFHFSRCSRMSRFWRKNSRSPLEIRDFEKNSLSLLERMRFCKQILFLFSILHSMSFPILVRNHSLLFGLILTISVLQKGKELKKKKQFCVVEQYSDFSLQKHFMKTTTTKSHLWEYFEWLSSGKGICKTCKNEIVDWLGWRVRTRGGGEEIDFFIVFDIGYNKMDNYCTARLMIIALWWWYCQTHNLYSGFGRQNSSCGEDLILRF